MGKFFVNIGKVIAFIVALLLVVAIPVAIISYDVGRVVFNPPLVKQVVTDLVTESDLIPVALEWFSERRAEERYEEGEAQAWEDEPDIVKLISMLEADDWLDIRQELLPDAILAEWVSVTVDGTYDWIDNEERVPQITLSLTPFINRVDSEHGRNAILIAYRELDPCTEDEIADFTSRLDAAPAGTEVLYNLCQFPDPWYEDQISDYVESLLDLVRNVPSDFALTGELAQTEDTAEGVGPLALKAQLRMLRLLMNLAPLIPLVLLLLILLFAVRSLKGLGKWWGIPITLGSLITFIIALMYRPLLTAILTSGPMSEVPSLIQASALRGIMSLMALIFQPMRGQSLVALFLGIILVIVIFVAKEETKEEGNMSEGAEEGLAGL